MKNITTLDEKKNFTEGKIFQKLFIFALPILLALFLQAAYGAADVFIVGLFGSQADVSGVGTGGQVMMLLTGIANGFAMGTTILLGLKLGQKKVNECPKIIGTSTVLFMVLAIILAIIFATFTSPLCRILQAPEEAFAETVQYVRICSIGLIFIVAYNVLGSICRGIGDSKTPLITVAISASLNVVLDILFVKVFHLASAGAAIATVISQGVSVLITLGLLFGGKRKLDFEIKLCDFKVDKGFAKNILSLGGPIALESALISLSFLFITAIVNGLGFNESAGMAIAEKLVSFFVLAPSAFMQALSAFVSQNYGAKKMNRCYKTLWTGIIISFSIGVILFFVTYFFGRDIASLFEKTPVVLDQAELYLKGFSYDTLLTPFLFCLMGFFNGIHRTKFVMVQDILGAFIVRMPVCYIMRNVVDNTNLYKIAASTPISSVFQITVSFIFLIIISKNLKVDMCEINK